MVCRGCGPAPSHLRAGVEKMLVDEVVEVDDVGAVPRLEGDGVDDDERKV